MVARRARRLPQDAAGPATNGATLVDAAISFAGSISASPCERTHPPRAIEIGIEMTDIPNTDIPNTAMTPADGNGSCEDRHSFYAEISREMVRLYKEQFGRGPTKARTAFAGADCLICTN